MRKTKIGHTGIAILCAFLILLFCPLSIWAYSQPKSYSITRLEQQQILTYARTFQQGIDQHKKKMSVSVNPGLVQKYGYLLVSEMIQSATQNQGTIHGYPSAYVRNSIATPLKYHQDTNELEMDVTYYTTWVEEDQAKARAKKIVDNLSLTGSTLQKVEILTQYIVTHYTYDWDKNRSSDSYAYTLKHKKTVMMCGGFSQMMYLLAQAAGLSDVQMVNGMAWVWGDNYGLHSWNTVQDEQGKRYVLDVTTAVGKYELNHQVMPDSSIYLLPEGTQNYQNRIPEYEGTTYHFALDTANT